jgi:hypothetical protein
VSIAIAAVGSERRPLGAHPLAVDTRPDRIVVKIERYIAVLFAHHIHVALQDHDGTLLAARRGGFQDHDVACSVLPVIEMVLFRKIDQKGSDLPLFFRRTRHPRNFIEVLPHRTGRQVGYF